MTVEVKHKFKSEKPDGTDASVIKPSNWNDSHAIEMTGPALVGKGTLGKGEAVEVRLSDDFDIEDGELILANEDLKNQTAAFTTQQREKLAGIREGANVKMAVDAVTKEPTHILGLDGKPIQSYLPLEETSLRQVASNCRYPEIFSTVRQIFSESQHRAGQTISSLMVEFCNFASNSELVKASALTIFTAIEYPILSGNIHIIGYHNGQMIGTCLGGGIIRSDRLSLPFKIPKGDWFSMWHHHSVFNNSDGIPMVKGLPSSKFGNTKGRCVIGGGAYPQLNYIMSKLNGVLPGLANTVLDGDDFITPTAIIENPADDYDFNSYGIIADSRSASATCLPTDARLLNGLAERLFCPNGESFISFACNNESEFNDFDPTTMYFQRRSHFLRYVDKIVNALGTNDASRFTSPAVTRALELKLLENRFIAGKKIYSLTVPYKASGSNDHYTSLGGQTMDANNANYDYLNDYRLTNPDGLYEEVKDCASIVCDKVAKKWKVGPRARVEVASIAAGTNIINVPAATLAPADNNVPAVMLAGTTNAALFGLLTYVSPTQATWWTLNKIRETTGAPLNAVVTVTNGSLYIDARHYTGDGVHDTPTGVLEQEAALA